MAPPILIITFDGMCYFMKHPPGESPNLWQFDPSCEEAEDAVKVRDLPVGYTNQDVADAIAWSQRSDQSALLAAAGQL